MFGEPAPGIRVLGGVSLLTACRCVPRILATFGRVAVGVPDVQLNLYGEYDCRRASSQA